MVVYSWTTASDVHAADGEGSLSRRLNSLRNMAVVPLKDISRVANVIEHLCGSHINRPAIIQRYRAMVNLD